LYGHGASGHGTTLEGSTDAMGTVRLTVATRRMYKLLVAHPQFPATIVERVDSEDKIRLTLPRTDNVGSVVIHSTGYIPGVVGRLSPILDTSGRRYLYADNVAIDGAKPQPAAFEINTPIELEDANGTVVYVTFKHIEARTSLLQYSRRS
jgi:hypothetical protein